MKAPIVPHWSAQFPRFIEVFLVCTVKTICQAGETRTLLAEKCCDTFTPALALCRGLTCRTLCAIPVVHLGLSGAELRSSCAPAFSHLFAPSTLLALLRSPASSQDVLPAADQAYDACAALLVDWNSLSVPSPRI
eukprot:2624675-Rhodomonas_salina.1